jgi:ABC-type cobalamin/Fe3+-siderophores transport system ATPase subunit
LPLPIDVTIATEDGSSKLSLNSGGIILIAGPNGVGKSALLAELYRLLGDRVGTYLPGHRQINFNTDWDAIHSGIETIYKRLFENADHFNRYKNSWAEEQFKSELRILQNRENEFNRNNLNLIKHRGEFIPHTGSCNDSPLDVVNEIFSQANFPIPFGLDSSGVSVSRRGSESYSVEARSDGERAALYLCAAFCNRVPGSVLLIDEPEKHLDRTISTVLIEACLRSRNDICVILSTHEPGLLTAQINRDILHLRDSKIVQPKPERRIYKISPLKADDDVTVLRADLMGVRDRVLFVEGSESSDDVSLYSLIYNGVKVVPKGSCSAVCEATKGIGRLVEGHWLEPRGIIDGDGRLEDEKLKLKKTEYFCCHTQA